MIRQPIITVMGHVDHGKCVSGDTVLELANGQFITAKDAFERFRQGEPILQPDGVVHASENLMLLSVDHDGKVVPRKASHVWKLSSNKLIQVTTKAGYSINATPEHKFLVLTRKGTIDYVESRDLKLGDSLLIPNKINTASINLSEIKQHIFARLDDMFLVKISKELNDKIEVYCRNTGIYALGNKLGDKTLWHHIRKQYYRPSILRKILSLMHNTDESYVYDNTEAIKFSSPKSRATHKSFWLKIPHAQTEFESLYYIVGLLYGDGISGNANLSNTSDVIIGEFRRCLMESFGIDATPHWRGTCYIVTHKGGKTFQRFLNCVFDYPETDKTRILATPDIICIAPNKLVSKFIQGFFDAEGFAEAANGNGNIGVGCESKILMKQMPSLLHRFGCLASFVKRKNRTGAELRISGSKNLTVFRDCIGFREPSKSRQLQRNIDKSASSRIFDMTPLDGSFVKEFRQKYGVIGERSFQLNYYESKNSLTTHTLSRLLGLAPNHNEQSLSSLISSYRTVQVTELKTIEGEFQVFDFTVEDTHNFIANNMVVHNTTLLDRIRNTTIANREAGGITQHIGASEVPIDVIRKICGPLLKKLNVEITIPGLLFIDTPGHEVFTNLRKRGGAVSDLAILVVDITKGFEPQTIEAIEILKEYKTPFLVAANKVDLITGWKQQDTQIFLESLDKQQEFVKSDLENKMYKLIGRLSELGFSSERVDRVNDFRKEISIIPLSAKTGEGVAELLMYSTGLSQRFLEKRLNIEPDEPGRGSIIEKKEEKGLGTTLDVILYNGTLRVNDTVAFATVNGVSTAKIRALLEPRPLQELRESAGKFVYIDMVSAAAGLKLSGNGFDDALPGSLIISVNSPDYEKEIATEIKEVFSVDKTGLILKTDTIGSLEALSKLLSNAGIKISKKGLGNVNKRDVLDAFAMRAADPYGSIVLAFNVAVEDDAKMESEAAGVNILNGNIIYKVLDDYKGWADKERQKDKTNLEKSLMFPGVVKVLPNYCFRMSHPAVFGVSVEAGKIKPSYLLMKENGDAIGRVKEIQDNALKLDEAKKGANVAISMDDITFGRQVKDNDILYTAISNEDIRALKFKHAHLLSDEDMDILRKLEAINK